MFGEDEVVDEDGADPAAVVVEAEADAPDEADAEVAAPPCLMTR